MSFFDIFSDAVKGIPLNEVLRERLALAEDKFVILDKEFSGMKLENENLKAQNRELRSELQKRAAQLQNLDPPGDKCPYCNRQTGKLEEIKPQPPPWNRLGLKNGFYKCRNPVCGKSYDKEMPS